MHHMIDPWIFIGLQHQYSEAIMSGDGIVPGHYCLVPLRFAQLSYVPCR